MQRPLPLFLLVAAATLAACTPSDSPDASPDSAWVGTITTEGNVTTVINESGSVWGGKARLVEELSIGVDQGEEPYMFGRVAGIAAHGDRIFVLDGTVSVIRVFDLEGEHLDDIGGLGEGPGEFGQGLRAPSGTALDDEGRIYVHARTKIEIFSPDGEHVDTWSLGTTSGNRDHFSIVVPAVGSVVLARTLTCEERFAWRCGPGLLPHPRRRRPG